MTLKIEKILTGKKLTVVRVNYGPNGKSGAHRHAGSVFAYVLSGAIRSENSATGPAKVSRPAKASSSRPEVGTW
jgi:quercetin dioxygenase-like cupin family protein